ncbi:MAG: flavodoxin [Clostridia bacterium]|nr:flavodoxin [Clostridia bacterium]NCC42716.1 flavodoxin [Clostridia bacterium]
MLKYKIVYSSHTGNTRGLATAIYQGLPAHAKDIEELSEDTRWDDAETYLVGFWTDKGNCPPEVQEYLEKLTDKRVALFGTCGFGGDEAYYKKIEDRVKKIISPDNEYLGCFLCQGKMPMAVRERYQKMMKDEKQKAEAQRQIQNFDRALLHPDTQDYNNAMIFVRRVCE